MVEVSEVGSLTEEEVELDLGLSIGGSFRRSLKLTPAPMMESVSRLNGFELKLREQQQHHQAWHGKPEGVVAVMDPQTKREIQALRRLEARKKREEKQQNKRVLRETDSEPDNHQQQQVCKREKTDRHDGGSEYPNVNLNLNGGGEKKQLGPSRVVVGSTASVQHPYSCVQWNNGFAYPCVVPWTVEEKNAGQPAAACNGFLPFSGNGYGSDPDGLKDCGDKKAKSDGSSMCSSSVVSDQQSYSPEGGGSSDSQSQSVQSSAEPNQLNNSSKQKNLRRSQLPDEQTASSIKSDHDHTVAPQQSTDQPPYGKPEQAGAIKQEKPAKKPPLSCHEKPPRPHRPQSQPYSLHLLAKMPYVSTTGNGQNGKRVNGFLYRYNNSEVSIVCVCHGSTFSPAGFVQHAGGTDISHPEKHITVITPPIFG